MEFVRDSIKDSYCGVKLLFYISFILQVVGPAVGCIWGNVPVFGSTSDVRTQTCESVENHQLPCESYRSFKLFQIFASDFGTMSMCR